MKTFRGEKCDSQNIRIHSSVLSYLFSAICGGAMSASGLVGACNHRSCYLSGNYHRAHHKAPRFVLEISGGVK